MGIKITLYAPYAISHTYQATGDVDGMKVAYSEIFDTREQALESAEKSIASANSWWIVVLMSIRTRSLKLIRYRIEWANELMVSFFSS